MIKLISNLLYYYQFTKRMITLKRELNFITGPNCYCLIIFFYLKLVGHIELNSNNSLKFNAPGMESIGLNIFLFIFSATLNYRSAKKSSKLNVLRL